MFYVLCSRETNVVLMYFKKNKIKKIVSFSIFKNYEKSFFLETDFIFFLSSIHVGLKKHVPYFKEQIYGTFFLCSLSYKCFVLAQIFIHGLLKK